MKSFLRKLATALCDLDYRISRTMEYKDKMLLVLKYPFMPLHNNQAELALRRIVRKRDISLHTMTRQGTRIRDAVLSVIETAQKLKLNSFNYIKTIISSDYSSLPKLKPANSL